jgi:hypothetical protein
MESSDSQSRRNSVVQQPAKTELIESREYHQDGSSGGDVRESKRELNARMRGLARLRARRQVGASNDEQPTRRPALTMRHISMVALMLTRR